MRNKIIIELDSEDIINLTRIMEKLQEFQDNSEKEEPETGRIEFDFSATISYLIFDAFARGSRETPAIS